ncbi:MAG TPA: DUF4129 domain-containing protein [Gemmatimonadales bacterium]|nr:DUF4129 domain-containing protein [Gemmatimonadales bacterium]
MIAAAQGDVSPAALRAVLDSVFAAPTYRWGETPAPLRWLREWWQRVGDWLASLRADNPAAFRLLVFALLIAVVVVLAHGAWVVWRTVRNARAPDEGDRAPAAAGARDAAWYLREADRAAAMGRMSEALQLGFVGLALTLDAQGILRYHPSKTPAECAGEARLVQPDRERLRAMVRTLYGHVFGGSPFGADDYRRWREDVGRSWHAPAH